MILHMLVQTMRFLKLMPILPASAMIMMAASCSSGKTDYESAILEWTGREIVFPDSMRLAGGEVFVKEPSDFTIVAYYDSVGCTGCRMKLPYWNEFMNSIDSVNEGYDIQLILIINADNDAKISELINKSGYKHTLLIDEKDIFNKVNGLAVDYNLRTFLLDSDDRILAIGNPVDNASLGKVYKDIIGNEKSEEDEGHSPKRHTHDFGSVGRDQSVTHEFLLTNEEDDTLRIRRVATSCECTNARVSADVIPPHSSYKVSVSFRDTVAGEFFRTVRVYFKNKTPEVQFELSGEVI